MFKVDEKLDGTNLMTEHMGKEILESDTKNCGLTAPSGRHADALKLEVDLGGISKGSVLLVLALSCLPRLADAADASATELDAGAGVDSVTLVCYFTVMLVLVVGCCCCWAGVSFGRRLGRHKPVTRSVGTMTEALMWPSPTGGQLNLGSAPQMVWTTTRAATLPGTGCFHVEERCGGFANAGSLKMWRRCLRPECGGDLM